MFYIGIEHVRSRLKDLPQRAACAFVVNPAPIVWVQLAKHAEGHQARKFSGCIALKDHLTRWLRLVKQGLLSADYPQAQGQPTRPTEQFSTHLADVHRRVPCPKSYLLFRI